MRAWFSWAILRQRFVRDTPEARRARRAVDPAHTQDFADYGTAFGLDMSIGGLTPLANHATAEPATAAMSAHSADGLQAVGGR
ncbi:MAG: hypothetical protein AB9M60_22455 [Leptothrix sp. (in: b-proteobacteria)]